MELDALIARDSQLKGMLKKLQSEGKLEKKDWNSALEKSRVEGIL